MFTRKKLVCLGVGALMVAVIAAGCGKAKEQAAEAILEKGLSDGKTKVDVDLKDGSEGQVNLTQTTDEGTVNVSVGPNTGVPKGWPADVTVYPGMTVNMSNVMAEQNNYMIQGTAAAALSKVKEFYTADMEKQGWKLGQTMSQSSIMDSFVAKKDDRQLTVVLVGEGENTTISLNVAKMDG